jgi:cytochrome c oxidase assembly protein subunit 15
VTPAAPPSPGRGLLRRLALANVALNVGIVLTGGLVRLTGSGLGCPTWPRCTPTSVVPTRELAVHGVIEFGNRLLTVVLGFAALALVVAALRLPAGRRGRPSLLLPGAVLLLGGIGHALVAVVGGPAAAHVAPLLLDLAGLAGLRAVLRATARAGGLAAKPSTLTLAASVLIGILAQAVLGGITVRTGLNPWTVSAHFLLSAALVAITLTAWEHLRSPAGAAVVVVRPGLRRLALGSAGVGALTIALGTVVTGSGPHSGDVSALRTGLALERVSQLHADAVFLLVGLAVGLLLASRDVPGERRLHSAARVLVAVLVAQGAIGFAEYFTGLPVVLVALHLVGACLTVLALTRVVHATREHAATEVSELRGGAVTVLAER